MLFAKQFDISDQVQSAKIVLKKRTANWKTTSWFRCEGKKRRCYRQQSAISWQTKKALDEKKAARDNRRKKLEQEAKKRFRRQKTKNDDGAAKKKWHGFNATSGGTTEAK
jgi:hypothetical protein